MEHFLFCRIAGPMWPAGIEQSLASLLIPVVDEDVVRAAVRDGDEPVFLARHVVDVAPVPSATYNKQNPNLVLSFQQGAMWYAKLPCFK